MIHRKPTLFRNFASHPTTGTAICSHFRLCALTSLATLNSHSPPRGPLSLALAASLCEILILLFAMRFVVYILSRVTKLRYCACLALFRGIAPRKPGATPRSTVSLPSPTTLSPTASRAPRPSSPAWVKLHYIAICVYSAICFISVLYESGPGASVQHYMCAPLPWWLRALSFTFTLSKIWEWLDTADHFLRGETLSKIGFLHLYHHATTFFLFLNVMNYPSTERSGMLMNGFVHFLMYAHYAFRLPKFFRPIITASQIAQLVTVTYIWHITPSTCGAPFDSFPQDHPIEHITPYTLVPVYTVFFLHFFARQYILPLVGPCFGVAAEDKDAKKHD